MIYYHSTSSGCKTHHLKYEGTNFVSEWKYKTKTSVKKQNEEILRVSMHISENNSLYWKYKKRVMMVYLYFKEKKGYIISLVL